MNIIRLPKRCNTLGLRKDYGVMITLIRCECGLSQLELAHRLGRKSATYISLIESNKRGLDVDTLEKICEICDVSVSNFFDLTHYSKEINKAKI